MTDLSINLNKIALLRNQRDYAYPNLIEAAETLLAYDIVGITVHPRPDERHIKNEDVRLLKNCIQGFPTKILNVEGNPLPYFQDLIRETHPQQVTLVPDPPEARTSTSGWSLPYPTELIEIIQTLRRFVHRISIFVNPEPELIQYIDPSFIDCIEIYTGEYAWLYENGQAYSSVLKKIQETAEEARKIGLRVHAGHDINLKNIRTLLDHVHIDEISIGHAFIADSLWLGMENALKEYLQAVKILT